MNLERELFLNHSNETFEAIALRVFQYQYEHCLVYREYVNQLGKPQPKSLIEIPFLPIAFFKTHRVCSENSKEEITFMSSGTGGQRSKHHVVDLSMYERSFLSTWEEQIGPAKEQVILALLPNYIEQGDSSLVYMVHSLIQKTNDTLSGFYLGDSNLLENAYQNALAKGKKVILIGVSYALLDLAERGTDFSQGIVIETGGMKGRRAELTKSELHAILKKGLHTTSIYSEYGMTELLSQAYSKKDGLFEPANTMRILLREVNDPFSYVPQGKTGGINVVDLANLYSCSFIETQDLGKFHENGFEIVGRFDHSDIRGCNLLIQ